MTIVNSKYFFFVLLTILFLAGCDMNNDFDKEAVEPNFNVYGDKDIINKLIINIRSIKKWNNSQAYTQSRIQTLLRDGKQFVVNNQAESYEVYFSYGDQVGLLKFNNDVYRPLNGNSDRINNLYVYKNDEGQIYLQHYATKTYAEKKQGFTSSLSIPFEEYSLESPRFKECYKERFYGDFPANIQVFQRDHLSRETIDFFKNSLPIEQKKRFGIFYTDLEKIDLPKKELEQILEFYKKEEPQLL